jgi:hypothetical protein
MPKNEDSTGTMAKRQLMCFRRLITIMAVVINSATFTIAADVIIGIIMGNSVIANTEKPKAVLE